jgi:hypothetical protein
MLHAGDRGHGREEVAESLKKLFSQFCAPVGKANLVRRQAAAGVHLKDLKIETHCKGVIGWVVNFLDAVS